MSLAGKVAVVFGGSGTVGSGIIAALLKGGATVIAPIRGGSGKESLTKEVGDLGGVKLDFVESDLASEEAAAKVADFIKKKYGHVDHIVSSLGSWWQKGPITSVSLEEFNKQVANLAASHFLAFKYTVPLLKQEAASSYTFVSGTAGELCFMPDASMVTVGAACLFGISLAARAEFQTSAIRVNELRIGAVIRRHADSGNVAFGNLPSFSNRLLGEQVVKIVQGSVKGEVVRVTPDTLSS